MTEPINVYVAGRPRPQPRGRPFVHCALAAKRRGKKCPAVVVSTMNDTVKSYRTQVLLACRDAAVRPETQELLAGKGGLSFTLVLWFASKDESRWLKPHTNVPDLDNVIKLFQDVAVDAGLIESGDGRVVHLEAVKAWNREGGALVRISPVTDDQMHPLMERMAGALDV